MRPQTRLRAAFPLALIAAIAFLWPAPRGAAVGSQTWRQRDREDFEKGEPHGVELSADGALRLSPRLDAVLSASEPYVWALARDARGVLYAAGGNDGRVDRIPPSGKPSLFFRADEPEVHALALDPAGNLYAGTSPGGRVYKIAPDGKKVWVCDTGEKYVWALAIDRQGALYAGTGIEGRVLRIDGEGRSRVLFDSAETHIRTLLLDGEGNLVAGTDGHGLVLRITPKGEGSVLYDAPLNEVAALALGPKGTMYAAAVGESGRVTPPQRPASQAQAAAQATVVVRAEGGPAPAPPSGAAPQETPPPPQPEQRVPIAMEGKVLAISPDGYAREVWAGSQEAILSLAALPDGDLLMGSSAEGRIYVLHQEREVSEVGRLSSSQATAMLAHGGEVAVGGSNFGSVSLLRSGHRDRGEFDSKVLDARSFASWGRLQIKADLPKGTLVGLATRSGNTEEADRTWSDWAAIPTTEAGGRVASPPARFLQWRATLTTDDASRTPALREVAVTYLQRNLPPEIKKVEVQAPGVSYQKVAAGGSGEGRSGGGDVEGGAHHRSKPQSRKGYEPGARSVTWQASDPNDDDLVYDVDYRAIDEKSWKRIRKEIDEDFVTLDGTTLPDGTYQFRVMASDAPSNPPGEALTAEAVSDYFDVDNTPPRLEGLKAIVNGRTARVTFTATDDFGIIREVAYSVDAGDWVTARPADGLNDSAREAYDVAITPLAPGEHSIVVRATDSAGNSGSGRAVVEIP